MPKTPSTRAMRPNRPSPTARPSKPSKSGSANQKRPGLAEQLHQDMSGPIRKTKAAHDDMDSDVDAMNNASNSHMDARTSKKILELARSQQLELAQESPSAKPAKNQVDADRDFRNNRIPNYDDDDEDENDGDAFGSDQDDDEFDDGDYEEFQVDAFDMGIDAADQQILEQFMPKNRSTTTNLSDLVMQKLQESTQSAAKSAADPSTPNINPKIVEVYTKVGILLSRYRSGPLPKPFKIIPTLRDWYPILMITNPSKWSPQAFYQATRIFSSNLNHKMAQVYYHTVMLERVRSEIEETKTLNCHVYMAIKKSVYKPAAFFKGFLLPLCESRTCTLRESIIVSSVLTKVSIPPLHASAALLKMSEMEYTGPVSLFIRVLLDKKYALPYMVVDALVMHYLRMKRDERPLPVLWHQSLLTFAQRYKEDITPEQKDALMDLIRTKCHDSITPEIRRELQSSVYRGQANANVTKQGQEDDDMGMDF